MEADEVQDTAELLPGSGMESPSKSRYCTTKKIFFITLEIATIAIISCAYSAIFILPYCNFLFRCGCTWTWHGGIKRCNIFNPEGPHCPWCAAPASINWLPQWGSAVVAFTAALVARQLWLKIEPKVISKDPSNRENKVKQVVGRVVSMTVVGILAFYLFGLILGWIFKLATGYPYFISK